MGKWTLEYKNRGIGLLRGKGHADEFASGDEAKLAAGSTMAEKTPAGMRLEAKGVPDIRGEALQAQTRLPRQRFEFLHIVEGDEIMGQRHR